MPPPLLCPRATSPPMVWSYVPLLLFQATTPGVWACHATINDRPCSVASAPVRPPRYRSSPWATAPSLSSSATPDAHYPDHRRHPLLLRPSTGELLRQAAAAAESPLRCATPPQDTPIELPTSPCCPSRHPRSTSPSADAGIRPATAALLRAPIPPLPLCGPCQRWYWAVPSAVLAGHTSIAQAGHVGTTQLGRSGFWPLAVELFFYFLNIFKSLQIQKFV
jgi:hypothetical protein